jgi:NADPH:quinone reductase-like Zn-dependent oxidoreductase
MRKILLNEYGTVDVLHEINEAVPTPNHGQILIKVAATSMNDPDIHIRQHGPFPTMPKEMRPTLPHMLGEDFSGIITAIGEGVTRFQVGDHVIGLTLNGTYAEYIALNENSLVATVPSDLDLTPLGGLYVTAATAWAAVVLNGKVQTGQKLRRVSSAVYKNKEYLIKLLIYIFFIFLRTNATNFKYRSSL